MKMTNISLFFLVSRSSEFSISLDRVCSHRLSLVGSCVISWFIHRDSPKRQSVGSSHRILQWQAQSFFLKLKQSSFSFFAGCKEGLLMPMCACVQVGEDRTLYFIKEEFGERVREHNIEIICIHIHHLY